MELVRVIDLSARSGHILPQNIIKRPQTVLVHGIGWNQRDSGGEGRSGRPRRAQAGRNLVIVLAAQDGEPGGFPVSQSRLVRLVEDRVQVLAEIAGNGRYQDRERGSDPAVNR